MRPAVRWTIAGSIPIIAGLLAWAVTRSLHMGLTVLVVTTAWAAITFVSALAWNFFGPLAFIRTSKRLWHWTRRNAVWVFAWIIPIVGLVVLGARGIQFYSHRWDEMTNPNFDKCVFGDPTCSVAAGTWALAVFAVFAFGAAVTAAVWGYRAHANETTKRLGEDDCCDDSQHLCDRTFYLSADNELLEKVPLGSAADDFEPNHRKFVNLGRCPIGSITIVFLFSVNNGKHLFYEEAKIGSLGVSDKHCERHIDIRTLKTDEVAFQSEAAYSADRIIDEFIPIDWNKTPMSLGELDL